MKASGIILGVVVGIVIVSVVVWVLLSKSAPGTPNSPVASPSALPPSPTALAASPISPSASITPPASSQSAVNFNFNVTSFNLTGLSSGTINAQLTNTGTAAAHNTWAKVELFSKGAPIKIDGQDYYRKDIGTVQAGETVTTQVTLGISPFDAPKVVQGGATINLTIISDEKTQTFTYNYPQ